MQPKWARRLKIAAIIGLSVWADGMRKSAIRSTGFRRARQNFFVGANLSSTDDDPRPHIPKRSSTCLTAQAKTAFHGDVRPAGEPHRGEITSQALIARMTHERIRTPTSKGRRTNDGQVSPCLRSRVTSTSAARTTRRPAKRRRRGERLRPPPGTSVVHARRWSKNLVTDGYEVDTTIALGAFGGVKFSPLSY
jgi:hypothetical protein